MAFHVTADSTDGTGCYAQKNFTLASEVWVRVKVTFTAATLADVISTTSNNPFLLVADNGGSWSQGVELDYDGVSASVLFPTNTDDGNPYSAFPAADTQYTIDLHLTSNGGSNHDVDLYVDNVLKSTGTGAPHTGWTGVVLGWPNGGDDLHVTYEGLMIGTTQGASDIFSDDFSAGDFSAYDDLSTSAGSTFTFGGSGGGGTSTSTIEGISIAFDDVPLEPDPTWTRIDDPAGVNVVQRWTVDRGRTSELEKTGTGTATIELIDTSGLFDPTNTAGTYYGKLNPMKQVAINLQNPVTNNWYTVFRGFIADWQFEIIDLKTKALKVTLECVDAFDLFASLEMTPGNVGNSVPTISTGDIYFDEDTGLDAAQTRINKALDDAGWDATLREVFTGNVGLQGSVYERNSALLSVIQDAADAEFPGGVANAFMRRDGALVFHGRLAKFNPTDVDYNITTWKAGDLAAFGSDSNTAVISGLQFSRSRDKIINACLSLPQNVDEGDVTGQLVTDATSITNYGIRSANFQDLLTRNGSGPTTAVVETKKFGTYYVDNYKDPKTRVDRLTFLPQPADSVYGTPLWLLMCAVDISDRVHLKTTHNASGGFNEYFFVEGVHYVCEPMGHRQHHVTLELDVSPASYFDTNPF